MDRPLGKFGIFNDHRESGPRFNISSEGVLKRLGHSYFYG